QARRSRRNVAGGTDVSITLPAGRQATQVEATGPEVRAASPWTLDSSSEEATAVTTEPGGGEVGGPAGHGPEAHARTGSIAVAVIRPMVPKAGRELIPRADDLEIDLLSRRVIRGGMELDLTHRQYTAVHSRVALEVVSGDF